MDWHLIGMFFGYALTVGAFLWKMGGFTSRLETILLNLKDEIVPLKSHESKIARLEERVTHLEKKKR